VDAGQAGRFRRAVIVERADDHQMLLASIGAQLVDGVKTAVADRQFGAIDGGDIDDGFVAQVRISLGEFRQRNQLFRLDVDDLLAVMQPGGDESHRQSVRPGDLCPGFRQWAAAPRPEFPAG
jgi:hypothetical protein